MKKRPCHKKRRLKRTFLYALLIVGAIAVILLYKSESYNSVIIPESLMDFAEKYPEAEKFVSDYPKNINKDFDMNVSHEVKEDEIPLFLQWDKRWGYKYYGNDFLAVTGCGPTCMSMVVCGLTGDTKWNPYEVACYAEEHGYYVDGVGTSWELMTSGAEYFGLSASYGTVSESYIRENLSAASPMICSMSPGDFAYTGHFIVLTGIDSDGNVIVNDPNSKINSEKHWSLEELIPQIKSLWVYSYNN